LRIRQWRNWVWLWIATWTIVIMDPEGNKIELWGPMIWDVSICATWQLCEL